MHFISLSRTHKGKNRDRETQSCIYAQNHNQCHHSFVSNVNKNNAQHSKFNASEFSSVHENTDNSNDWWYFYDWTTCSSIVHLTNTSTSTPPSAFLKLCTVCIFCILFVKPSIWPGQKKNFVFSLSLSFLNVLMQFSFENR